MNIGVVGLGYVGLIQAVGLAELGHVVYAYDHDERKMGLLKKGRAPIYEPGLDQRIKNLIPTGKLHVCDHIQALIAVSDILFVCVGTPPLPHGDVDLSAVEEVVQAIMVYRPKQADLIVVIKSTVPIGTGDALAAMAQRAGHTRLFFVSNPEFLRQGRAVRDFFHPDRIIFGLEDDHLKTPLSRVYDQIPSPVLWVDRKSAELIKYAANAFLATKLSFINSIGMLCDAFRIDVSRVSQGIGMDRRIGRSYLRAGLGFGGSCLPKDSRAVLHMAEEQGVTLPLLEAAIATNDALPRRLVHKLHRLLGDTPCKIALLGLTFKPHTDDLRESPALKVIETLLPFRYDCHAFDPVIPANHPHPMLQRLTLHDRLDAALSGAHAVVLLTDWPEFQVIDWARVRPLLRRPFVLDGRHALDRQALTALGYHYEGIMFTPLDHSPNMTVSSTREPF